MKNLELKINEIELLVNKCQDVFRGFEIADLFMEECNLMRFTIHNNVFKDHVKNKNYGFSSRGNIGTTDFIFSKNTIKTEDILESLEELSKFSNQGVNFKNPINFKKLENQNLYNSAVETVSDSIIRNFLQETHDKILSKCNMIQDLEIIFLSSTQKVCILNDLGNICEDLRPSMKLRIHTLVSKNQREKRFFESSNSRIGFEDLCANTEIAINDLIIRIEKMIDAQDSISGIFPIIFSQGDGTLIHEAIGHPLEADFHRKETSVFLNQSIIAPEIVNVIDAGNMFGLNGSINFDDEGIATKKNILVENGVMKNLISDRKNAKLLGIESSGNGRRQSALQEIMPRMTNTYIEASHEKFCSTFDDMVNFQKKSINVVHISHGAVDISSGQFSFTADEAYLIENNQCTPLKECVFSGLGKDVLANIQMIGHSFDQKPGTCGKNGSWVPVTCGQANLLVSNMTLG